MPGLLVVCGLPAELGPRDTPAPDLWSRSGHAFDVAFRSAKGLCRCRPAIKKQSREVLMPTNSFRTALTCLVLGTTVAGTGALAADPNLDSTDVMIPSGEVGIELFVRNKHPAGVKNFSSERILLYVHG